MRFCLITHVVHKYHNGKYYGYSPYIREMNIWNKYSTEVVIIAPLVCSAPNAIESAYNSANIKFISVPQFSSIGLVSLLNLIWKVPYVFLILILGILRSDHIHLRCPGNMGLLGAIVQILFPKKKKTAKYAGNWDWNSIQPWSYRMQQRILRNTFLTRNMQVLVYGDWKETKNIRPFFTASYSEKEIMETLPRKLDICQPLKLIFIGGLNEGKRPKLSLEVSLSLHLSGIQNQIHFYGDGIQRSELEIFIQQNQMGDYAFLHGNVSAENVKQAYQNSHFLIFASKSEGWPKVVSESMFWGCLPITTAVSCVPEMIGNGCRGDLVEPNVNEITSKIEYYISHQEEYCEKCQNAMIWSRKHTLEKFESEIKELFD